MKKLQWEKMFWQILYNFISRHFFFLNVIKKRFFWLVAFYLNIRKIEKKFKNMINNCESYFLFMYFMYKKAIHLYNIDNFII